MSTQLSDDLQMDIESYFDSSHIGMSKEIVEEFIHLNEDFSKRLPVKPSITTKPKIQEI
ncbi:11789_t:CDS:2 [Rhizophagus irregularis]|nr:11789_t:CDS:2 [Rhizophagus irregularis]